MRDKLLSIIKDIKKSIIIEDSNKNYRLLEDFNMDSIEIMELVVETENEFDVEFSLDELDLENLSTIDGVESMVNALLEDKE